LVNPRVDVVDSVASGVLDNLLSVGIMIGIGVVEFVLVQFCGHFFSCAPLALKEQFFSVAIAARCIPYGFLIRKIPEAKVAQVVRTLKRPAPHDE
jgi:hypothetical protein